MEYLLEKLSKKEHLSQIQKRYYRSEKGQEKAMRNNEHRRYKRRFEKVMRELLDILESFQRVHEPN